jgi:hypothetical protein
VLLLFGDGREVIYPVALLRAQFSTAWPDESRLLDPLTGLDKPIALNQRTAPRLAQWLEENREDMATLDLSHQAAEGTLSVGPPDSLILLGAFSRLGIRYAHSRGRRGAGGQSGGQRSNTQVDDASFNAPPASQHGQGEVSLNVDAPPASQHTRGGASFNVNTPSRPLLTQGERPPITPPAFQMTQGQRPPQTLPPFLLTQGERPPLTPPPFLMTQGQSPPVTPSTHQLLPHMPIGKAAEQPIRGQYFSHHSMTPRDYPVYDSYSIQGTHTEGTRSFEIKREKVKGQWVTVVEETIQGGTWSSMKVVMSPETATPHHVADNVRQALSDIELKGGGRRDPAQVGPGVYWRLMPASPETVVIHVQVPVRVTPEMRAAAEREVAGANIGPGGPQIRVQVHSWLESPAPSTPTIIMLE